MIDINNPQTWIAGPKLDAKLAEIMGKKWQPTIRPVGKAFCGPDEFCDMCLEKYSTTGDGMLLMLEWIGTFASAELRKIGRNAPNWTGCLTLFEPGEHWSRVYFYEYGDTAPLAVARAILAWHAAQQEGETG